MKQLLLDSLLNKLERERERATHREKDEDPAEKDTYLVERAVGTAVGAAVRWSNGGRSTEVHSPCQVLQFSRKSILSIPTISLPKKENSKYKGLQLSRIHNSPSPYFSNLPNKRIGIHFHFSGFISLYQTPRFHAYENAKIYKEKTKFWHDRRIVNRKFEKGQQGKLKSRWSGPFTIAEVGNYGTVDLINTHDGSIFRVNGHRVKHFLPEGMPKTIT
ncbi:hypothetical protein OSB04_019341 [Centaurea solstitialis]|uniref:Reverse transcriptase domain-containing protein n=1 Tax=Centaurea solstitialis TaxID=347529 RepID=A0AA38SXS2_9ASTR|nr:hypothetical protein OSB04_019341 [Centaurea solstitialis]